MYEPYINAIMKQIDQSELTFKSDPNYQYVLEHPNFGPTGLRYLTSIKSEFDLTPEEIARFTVLNDSFGKPELVNYGFISCSPTSLRYVYHAHLILKYMQDLGITNPKIAEVGGGYGGLCMALHTYAEKFGVTIQKYSIVDLEAPGKLQRRVLDSHGFSSVNCHNAENFGIEIEQDSFLISAYAFSEIDINLQKQYIDVLFPKVPHGFIVWNNVVYEFGKIARIEEERPKTGPLNKFVYF